MDCQELCHILAKLNYNGLETVVVPDCFLKPNFTLVLDLLKWFAQILSKEFDIPPELRDLKPLKELPEASILGFLSKVGQLFSSQLAIQLDLVALYKADGSSVSELLKVARAIERGAKLGKKICENCNIGQQDANLSAGLSGLEDKLEEALSVIQGDGKVGELSQLIGETSGQLEALLSQEESFNAARVKVMDRRLELDQVQRVLDEAHEGVVAETLALRKANLELEKDIVRLDERLSLKAVEVSGAKKRLANLLLHSPAYMVKYEKLHQDYEIAYEAYVSRQRSLAHLKWVLYSDSAGDYFEDGEGDEFDEDGEPKVEGNHDADLHLERANPSGSTPAGAGFGLVGALGTGGSARVALPEGTGPPRLAESLLVGASKPMSASLTVEEAGGGARVGPKESAGRVRATAGGTAGRWTAGGAAGNREYDGLLYEFTSGSGARAEPLLAPAFGNDDQEADDDDELTDGLETSDDNDEEEDGPA